MHAKKRDATPHAMQTQLKTCSSSFRFGHPHPPQDLPKQPPAKTTKELKLKRKKPELELKTPQRPKLKLEKPKLELKSLMF